jgi:arylsulfatase A-like enzyme
MGYRTPNIDDEVLEHGLDFIERQHAAGTPFRSEKNTNWEGAFRVPEVVRWPGKIPAGVVPNEIIQHHDW